MNVDLKMKLNYTDVNVNYIISSVLKNKTNREKYSVTLVNSYI